MTYAVQFVPANNPSIQYFGRWDFSDSLHPRHSWPGTSVCTGFTGKSIGVRMADSINYYNVTIDGIPYGIFHGSMSGDTDYILADNLENTHHTLRLSKRNIVFDAVFAFSGFLIDDGAVLEQLPAKPARRIEFIGDSFTAAESNEATVPELAWEDRFPVTNIDQGFAAMIARHYNADYMTVCRSGIGLVCDWEGKTDRTMPMIYDRALMESPEPKWDFSRWKPDLVVIGLGLNDHSGLQRRGGDVAPDKSSLFRKGYHEFLTTIRSLYPGVKILALAAFPDWIRMNVGEVVEEEKKDGKKDIDYATYDEFPGGYVAYGHPTIATHRKMADQIIAAIDSLKIFTPGN